MRDERNLTSFIIRTGKTINMGSKNSWLPKPKAIMF
jgi:hypothetical protein